MKNNNKKAFTFIELLVVMAVLSIFISVILSFQANKAIEWTSVNRVTYTEIRNEIHRALTNSTTGYGWISLWEDMRNEKTLLPESFMVFFRSSLENDNLSWYFDIIETQKREFNNISYTRIINKNQKEYNTSEIFLKTIRMKTDESDSWTNVNSFWVSFQNPTGRTSFYINDDSFIEEWIVVLPEDSFHTINEILTPTENTIYNIAELDFYSNDWRLRFTQKIYKDKQFPVSLNY